ncbi:MAG: tRNA (N(6)-L-threonylcarbamoyladenosine(37)-C(2))-methylthiotransferase MtaB [Nitrospirae bacterium]|nr:tRNA (N(6)-L-threonylcarbamoyladenosine(37)-C(2))-methylthiotransferase MtaB [Nitrospirota bacterium]
MKIAVLTLGCKTNQAESNYIKNAAVSAGHTIVSHKDSPDVCIVNTCTVTAKSDYQSRQMIRRVLRTGAKVFVTGCYSELRADDILAISPELSVISNRDKYNIVSMLGIDGETASLSHFSDRSRPFVKIQDGCNYSCSYCTIPRARGGSRSRPAEEIVREIRMLEESEFAEVVLTGIHVGHYGYDLKPKVSLSYLLDNILKSTSKVRIRLSSIEINEIDDRLLELLNDQRVCPHLHIPLQSGDDTVLKRMRRPYDRRYYICKVGEILKRYAGIALGTDVIVGFPGEGEEEFSNTRRLIEEIPFSYLHVFPYSDRPGTPSAGMSGHVSPETKKMRTQELKNLDSEKRRAYRRAQIGRSLNVVCERRLQNGLYTGKSENYLNIYFANASCQPGRSARIWISEVFQDGLIGIPLQKEETL